MQPQYPGPIGPVQPSGMHGIPTGTLLPPPPGYGMMDPATPYPVPAGGQSVPPPPPDAGGNYPDGGLPADPNAPIPPGATTMPPSAGATPTTAAAAAMGFPQSEFSLAMQQRMQGGGVGAPMDFYNFIKNRGAQPPPAAGGPQAQPMQPQPRPIVMSATNTSPAQVIPQGAAAQGQGGPPPPPDGSQMGQPPMPLPGQIPGGIPANPQMPGFYGNRMAGR